MIKYLGSKRRLVPVLTQLFAATAPRRALDLFTGTTRVAQALKAMGTEVTAVDNTRFAATFARCYVATDAMAIDHDELAAAVSELDRLPGVPGYVTETFCHRSRFFQPENGARIDAVRQAIADHHAGTALEPVLLTSLIEAADRVDSTTGLQMAYVKQWSRRSFRPLELRVPELLPGHGVAVETDALTSVRAGALGSFDLAYLDPPYNQHRYEANYHVWETIVAWDAPAHYGVACKRDEIRSRPSSVFNSRRTMPGALAEVVSKVDAEVVVLSYNDESFLSFDQLLDICAVRGHVEVLAVPADRYVGARIGIHSPTGERVGTVGRLRNVEYVFVAGPRPLVTRAVSPVLQRLTPQSTPANVSGD